MTVLFFALSGLDVMNALDTIEDQKNDIIKWIYAQQVVPSNKSMFLLKFISCIYLL